LRKPELFRNYNTAVTLRTQCINIYALSRKQLYVSTDVDAGFERSWKSNLRLTTRAEDSHAAPGLSKIKVQFFIMHACTIENCFNQVLRESTQTQLLPNRFENGKVFRGSSVYTACSTACKSSRQLLRVLTLRS